MLKLVYFLFFILLVQYSRALMVGGHKELDVEDDELRPILQDLARYSINKIAQQRIAEDTQLSGDGPANASKYNYSLIQVVSASSQVVAGLNWFLKLRMKSASCKRSCSVEVCEVEVYERKWDNFRNLTDFNCVQIRRQQLLGSMQEIPTDNENALKALDFTMDTMNQASNNFFRLKVVKLNKAYRQVVSGFKYVFDFSVGSTNCTKNQQQVLLSDCSLQSNANVSSCKVTVWDQPWMEPRYKLMNQDCNFV